MLANDDLGNLGRLGNQMFQYAALRGLASKHGYEYCLPPREVVATRDPNVINSDITMFECFKIPDAPRRISNFQKVMESTFALDENLWNNCTDNISLYGYFQTEKYFKHIEDKIRNDFTFKKSILSDCRLFYNEHFMDTEVISLHVRRGDYLVNPNHPVQKVEYYKQALANFDEKLPVIVFSDDHQWCDQQKIFSNDRFFISQGEDAIVDLCIMSMCDYHIISNSSYSWWAAWLAKSKKVIAPKEWFGGELKNTKDTKDLYCDGWIII